MLLRSFSNYLANYPTFKRTIKRLSSFYLPSETRWTALSFTEQPFPLPVFKHTVKNGLRKLSLVTVDMTRPSRKLSGNSTRVSSTQPFIFIPVNVLAPHRLPCMSHLRYHTSTFRNTTKITVLKLRPVNHDQLSTCHIRHQALPLWWRW